MRLSEMLEAVQRGYKRRLDTNRGATDLEPSNEFLQDLVDNFGKTRSQANKAQVACFNEVKSSNVGAIVGKQARTVR
jgi:hypothetical protein